MSWQYHKDTVEGIRRVKWDALWHVMYQYKGKDTYDRVDEKTAMRVLKMIEKRIT